MEAYQKFVEIRDILLVSYVLSDSKHMHIYRYTYYIIV